MQRSGDTYTVRHNSGTPISGAYTTLSKTYTLGTGIRCPSYRKSNEGTSEVRLTGVRLIERDSAVYRAIFAWPWNKHARTKQKQKTNGNRAIWLVYRTDTNARCFRLVKRTIRWKNFMPENFLEINRYTLYVILQHDWPIEQYLLHIRVGGKG